MQKQLPVCSLFHHCSEAIWLVTLEQYGRFLPTTWPLYPQLLAQEHGLLHPGESAQERDERIQHSAATLQAAVQQERLRLERIRPSHVLLG